MDRVAQITDDEWTAVNPFNRDMVENFLADSVELSPQSLKSYRSNLKIFFWWVKEHLNNKKFLEIRSLDFKRFMNWMSSRGCSSSDIRTKKSSVSSFFTYIETYYLEDFPMFRTPINKSIKMPPNVQKNKKDPLTIGEFNKLIDTLRAKGELQKVAYAMFSLSTGARRAEVLQLTRDMLDIHPIMKTNEDGGTTKFYTTSDIRTKGRGEVGKIRKLTYDENTYNALRAWVDTRTDDCKYVFVSSYGKEVHRVSETTFNNWTKEFSIITGKRCTPHGFRSSRATQLVLEQNKSVKAVQKLLGHESSIVTEQHYIIRPDTDDIGEIYES